MVEGPSITSPPFLYCEWRRRIPTTTSNLAAGLSLPTLFLWSRGSRACQIRQPRWGMAMRPQQWRAVDLAVSSLDPTIGDHNGRGESAMMTTASPPRPLFFPPSTSRGSGSPQCVTLNSGFTPQEPKRAEATMTSTGTARAYGTTVLMGRIETTIHSGVLYMAL